MRRMLINENGSIIGTLKGSNEMVELNTPLNSTYVDDKEPTNLSDYWNGLEFVSIGKPPSPHHIFDYTAKQWIDPRELDEIKAQKWAEIKSQRDQLEFGGFEFEGNVYDSDQVSQGRIMGAAVAGIEQTWTLANNTTVELTAQQLKELYAALQAHIAGVHERGRIARQLIFDAETKEQIKSIQL